MASRHPPMHGVHDPATVAAVRTYVKLMRASRGVAASVEHRLAHHKLTITQLGVLEAVLHLGPLTHRDLRRKLLTSAGNLSDVIDKLARRGLASRVRGETDRRQVAVELTPAGRHLIEMVFPLHAADIARAMSGLPATELAQLEGLLRRLGRAAQAGVAGQAGLAAGREPAHLPAKSFDVERVTDQENSR